MKKGSCKPEARRWRLVHHSAVPSVGRSEAGAAEVDDWKLAISLLQALWRSSWAVDRDWQEFLCSLSARYPLKKL